MQPNSHRCPGQPPAIAVSNLSVTLGGNKILQDLSVQFPHDNISGLIGPNGAGKSTLLNFICRIIPAVTGDLFVFGVDAKPLKTHQMLGIGLGRTFQGSQFVSELTVLDNVKLGWHIRMKENFFQDAFRTPQSRLWERNALLASKDALERVGCSHLEKRIVRELSFGDQRKIDVARALVTTPKCLLLDEPMAGLSADEKDRLSDVLLKLRENNGPTIILVEHDMRVVGRLCSVAAVLDAGKLIAQGATKDVLALPVVTEAYMGRQHSSLMGRQTDPDRKRQ